MLDDVALLAEQYPDDAWELLLGYDQERLMGAGAVVRAAKEQIRPHHFQVGEIDKIPT